MRTDPLVGFESLDEIASTSALPNVAPAANESSNGSRRCWIERLAHVMRPTGSESGARLQTMLSCDLRARRPMLYLPPEMGALQPANLAWLRGFARRHGFGLAEARRRADVSPVSDQRGREPGSLALGIGLLLSQAGMPSGPDGGACTLSNPHRLGADSPHVGLDELVRMAAHARPGSKRVVLLPNRLIVETTGHDTHPIVAHACRLSTPTFETVLSQFDSPSFRCLGYSSGTQYVMHVFLAGGRAAAPELWTRLHTLTQTDFRFRLFSGGVPAEDFGLFHATFHYDVADSVGAVAEASRTERRRSASIA